MELPEIWKHENPFVLAVPVFWGLMKIYLGRDFLITDLQLDGIRN